MTDKTVVTPVIMSGGSGTRLWPMSRQARPKQLRALMSDHTLLQETALRASGETGDVTFGDPIIICNAAHREEIAAQMDAVGITPAAIVLEPVGRNTAPCAAAAAALMAETGDDGLMLLLPADHHIRDAEGFRSAVARAAGAARDGALVTFGIRPDGPETGYGYIRRGEKSGAVYTVDQFVEKPDRETAERYLEEGLYSWNAGIFLFRADRLAEEMRGQCPEILDAAAAALKAALRSDGVIALDPAIFADCPSDSIDYAVMEKTSRAAVLPMDIGWSDIGSWSALWELADKDEAGLAAHSDRVIAIGARNSYVRSDGPLVAALGVEDLIVVASGDAVLIARRDAVQDVKKVVEELKDRGRKDLV